MQPPSPRATIESMGATASKALLALMLVGTGQADPSALSEARSIDLEFSAELVAEENGRTTEVKLEGGALNVGVELEGKRQGHARVEVAVSSRVAALRLRF